jgi:hypothetical protein
MISLCRKAPEWVSGSGPEDNFLTCLIECPRLNPTNKSYQPWVDKDDCRSSSGSRCDGSKGLLALYICSEVRRWRGSQGISEHGSKGARRAVA